MAGTLAPERAAERIGHPGFSFDDSDLIAQDSENVDLFLLFSSFL
jgi:hypothetical protein